MTRRHQRWIDENGDAIDEDHRGLVYDVQTLIDRRRALGIFGGLDAHRRCSPPAACSRDGCRGIAIRDGDGDARPRPRPRRATAAASEPVAEVPDETGGPYPGDGSNGVNVLDDSGHRAQRHPLELRLVDDGRARACRSRSRSPCGMPRPAARSSARACTSGTATATATVLALQRRASRTRTTCAACRRPTRPAR